MCKSSFQKSMNHVQKLNTIKTKNNTSDTWLSDKVKYIERNFFKWLVEKTSLREDDLSDDDIDIKPYIEYVLENERAASK